MNEKDAVYLRWIRSLPCDAERHGGCLGEMHAHHIRGGKSLSSKRSDHQTLPLCYAHHDAIHRLNGPFKGWNKARLKEYERDTAGRYRQLYLGLGSSDTF